MRQSGEWQGWKRSAGYGALLLAFLAGVALLSLFKTARIDLTEDRLYTLSAGSRHILRDLSAPVDLTLYYSEELAKNQPLLRNYAKRVQDLLNEYVRLSDGKVRLHVVKPALYSEEEDQAAAAGLQGLPTDEGQKLFLGLVGERGDQHETVPFLNPQQERLLEYQISQLVYRVGKEKPATVAVISRLPIFRSMDMRSNQVRPPWVVLDQLKDMFDVRQILDTKVSDIEPDVDLVMLVHPRLLPEKTLYAIDQFVLRGGKLLVFVDPLAELDDSEDVMGAGFTDKSSTLEKLFDAWGIQFDPKKVLLDMEYAHQIPVAQYGREVAHPGILGLHDGAINREQNVIAELDDINVGSAGAIAPVSGAATAFVPLLMSSTQSQMMDADAYALVGSHENLVRQFKSDGQSRTLAALVSGMVGSAYPQGAPVLAGETAPSTAKHLTASVQPIQVMVVADTDVLADRMWADVQDFYGQKMVRSFAANADMVTNMIEALTGSTDLIGLRSRGTYQRPFTRVDELERAASTRLKSQQDALMASLAETEKKITELDRQGQTAAGDQALSAEQQAALLAFQQTKQETRRQLREVQRQLNQDVEQLGVVLKIINMTAVPAVLTVLILVLAWFRGRKARLRGR